MSPTFQGYDSYGEGLWTAEAPTLPEALAQVDASEESGLKRTNLAVLRDNRGYVEDFATGEIVYDTEDDDE